MFLSKSASIRVLDRDDVLKRGGGGRGTSFRFLLKHAKSENAEDLLGRRRRAAAARGVARRASEGNGWRRTSASRTCSVGSADATASRLRRSSAASEASAPRRGGVTWASSARSVELRPAPGGRPGRSCLKVATLEDSLRSCGRARSPSRLFPSRKNGGWNLGGRLLTASLKPKGWRDPGLAKGGAMSGSATRTLAAVQSTETQFEHEYDDDDDDNGDNLDDDVGGNSRSRSGDSISSHSYGDSSSDEENGTPLVPKPTSINFTTLEMRTYEIGTDDNPGLSSTGPAVSLSGWDFISSELCQIDDYESTRTTRRRLREIKLSPEERESRLRASGVSKWEIRSCAWKIRRAREGRRRTLRKLRSDSKYEERAEKWERRRMRLWQGLGMRKSEPREEEELWDRAQHK